MEANAVGPKRILKSTDEAKSPHRILVRSLLKSRNKLREKYRELRAECKRWRNQAVAVERSRSTWRKRALAHEARAQEDQAARANLESQLRQLREQSEQREVESAELPRDWPLWKGRKKTTAKNEARTEQGCFVSFCSALSKTWRPTGTPRRSIRCPTAGQPTPTSDSGNLTCWIGIAPLAAHDAYLRSSLSPFLHP